ncbi:hypothetical protein MIMGU_mgv11b017487mg [Erythranthe guttata]|uniref:S-protein homolog n=1 Tax=Erythranthe guttata TaxID=4155 RepID=A0A022RI40_ERYGU|nr:hypothetical protein MIMGU_mgv11b017487mg [Erythranthe guttata]
MKNLVPFLVVFANIYLMMFVNMTSGCGITEEYEVHVTNRLPSPQLRLHCASKNDDLGYHNIDRDYDFNWRFCENWTGNTLFFCHLWWNNNDVAFDVFKSHDDNPCLHVPPSAMDVTSMAAHSLFHRRPIIIGYSERRPYLTGD